MEISATDISRWADKPEARSQLPRLVRRLILATTKVDQLEYIDFPAGSATDLPGFDGSVSAREGNAWVPAERSVWELSCRQDPKTKANEDYRKRTEQTAPAERRKTTFVFVTVRRFPSKNSWLGEKKQREEWKDIKFYDSGDLEQWLEAAPSVALWLAEVLDVSCDVVESPQRFWESWSQRTRERLTADAIKRGRKASHDRLLECLKKVAEGNADRITVIADSVEEAVAFTCVTVADAESASVIAAVVTKEEGWRFIDANPGVRLAIVVRPELAHRPAARSDLTIVVPQARGDVNGYSSSPNPNEIILERPNYRDFEEALISLGIENSEAERLVHSTGRSWSVLSRQLSRTPAASRPSWMDLPEARSLTLPCLVGAWSADNEADQQVITEISDRPYEEIERNLAILANLEDDVPVLQIGAVWKAKSPIELLSLFGPRLTSAEIDRFFQVTLSIFRENDPKLELPEDRRHMARILGKCRPHSEFLLESLMDGLIKLAVRASDLRQLGRFQFEARVDHLVADLLENADRLRWLSLSDFLRSLAEASPNRFLQAVESSLQSPDRPVLSLLHESSSNVLWPGYWHTHLLWGLEVLAWSPRNLDRVVAILSELSKVGIKENGGNTPFESLLGIFRTWLPRTAASLDQRKAAFDRLSNEAPEIAFKLAAALVLSGMDMASPQCRPRWRDDDARAGYGVTDGELYDMRAFAADKMLDLARGHADRVAVLIEKLLEFDDARIGRIFDLCRSFASPETADSEKVILRDAIRRRIHWLNNYGNDDNIDIVKYTASLESAYEELAPKDVCIGYAWLFRDQTITLPLRTVDLGWDRESAIIAEWRVRALSDVYDSCRMEGVVCLAQLSGGGNVGRLLDHLNLVPDDVLTWLLDQWSSGEPADWLLNITYGYLWSLEEETCVAVLHEFVKHALNRNFGSSLCGKFLILAPFRRSTWDIVAVHGREIASAYWENVRVDHVYCSDAGELNIALQNLLDRHRPHSALSLSHFDFTKAESQRLIQALDHCSHGEENAGPRLRSWHLAQLIKELESRSGVDRDQLIKIEFWLLSSLMLKEKLVATFLFRDVMRRPDFFVELLKYAYKSKNGEAEEELTDHRRTLAEISHDILNHCQTQPGSQDEAIDDGEFIAFIEESRRLAEAAGRLEICDEKLGEIIARGPDGVDGRWPSEPTRIVLDRLDAENLRDGFRIGCFNKRGMTRYGCYEGGDQERSLADQYQAKADSFRSEFPRLASVFDDLAKSYRTAGDQRDLRARLNREGY